MKTLKFALVKGARPSSVIDSPFVVRWVIGSTHHCGSIEFFIVQANAPQVVYQMPWHVLPSLSIEEQSMKWRQPASSLSFIHSFIHSV